MRRRRSTRKYVLMLDLKLWHITPNVGRVPAGILVISVLVLANFLTVCF